MAERKNLLVAGELISDEVRSQKSGVRSQEEAIARLCGAYAKEKQ